MFAIITSTIAIIGALCVAKNKALAANAVWSISNPALVVYNHSIGQVEQAVMFAMFSLVAWYGVYNLKLGKCKGIDKYIYLANHD